jgi:hypothetical protein
MPCSGSIALMPRKQISALICLIFVIASPPTVIFEFFEIRSPIKMTSIFGCWIYSIAAGKLPVKKVARKCCGNAFANSRIVVPPVVRINMPSRINVTAF